MSYLYKTLLLILSSTLLFGVTNFSHAQENAAEEGIQVHGDWTITVNDENGNFIKEKKFENSLVDAGSDVLSDLLNGEASSDYWQIIISGSNNQNEICVDNDENPSACFITGGDTSGPTYFQTLTTSAPNSGDNKGSFIITGSLTAETDGSIYKVDTRLSTEGDNPGLFYFTSKFLDSSVDISANQQVTVTVEISFS